MKNFLFVLISLILTCMISTLVAQQRPNLLDPVNFHSPLAPLFGRDVIISNLPDQNQSNLTLCSAPNGWLYAAYKFDSIDYFNLTHHWFCIMRSKDNGISWNRLVVHSPYANYPIASIKKLDMVVCGDSDTNRRIFLGWIIHEQYPGYQEEDFISVFRYKDEPFSFEGEILSIRTPYGRDLCLASDGIFPPVNSYPNSLGVLFTRSGIKDSIIFRSSDNGGLSFNKHRVVAVSSKRFTKVTLSYGRSMSQNNGQYFAAWEEVEDTTSTLGHIYTSHSDPDFNSKFTTPVKLDDLEPSLTNLCRNPVVACQNNNIDNDSADLTSVVIFEKYKAESGTYEVTGFYNKRSSSGKIFNRLNISSATQYACQPDINFNPHDSTFIVTYFDSAAQKLPLLTKNLNLINPDGWNIATPNYSENTDLLEPHPVVSVNHGLKKAIVGWIANRPSGNGMALFNASYIPATGIEEKNTMEPVNLVGVFPNPCSTYVAIAFQVKKAAQVAVSINDLTGKQLRIFIDKTYSTGNHLVTDDLSCFSAGTYLLKLTSGSYSTSKKIIIAR